MGGLATCSPQDRCGSGLKAASNSKLAGELPPTGEADAGHVTGPPCPAFAFAARASAFAHRAFAFAPIAEGFAPMGIAFAVFTPLAGAWAGMLGLGLRDEPVTASGALAALAALGARIPTGLLGIPGWARRHPRYAPRHAR